MSLATDFRPKTFSDIVGQSHVRPVLRAMVLQQNPHPALIFGGSRGTGKTTAARVFAAALNCGKSPELKGDCCAQCVSCQSVQRSKSLSVLEYDAASNNGVDEIRKIKDLCGYAVEGLWRVVLLDEAHMLTSQAFNALLKVLEEPPQNTVFVMLTTETSKIIETVRSRSMTFEFRRMSTDHITSRLAYISDQRGMNVESGLLKMIADRVQGGMRDAIMLLDQIDRVGCHSVEDFKDLFGVHDVSAQLLSAALDGDLCAGAEIIEEHLSRAGDATGMVNDLVLLMRDVAILRGGGLIGGSESDVAARQALATRLDDGRMIRTSRILWDVKTRVRAIDNDHRAAMHMAFMLMCEAAGGVVTPEPIHKMSASVNRTMDLASMQALAGA